jgi:hypothetical protein
MVASTMAVNLGACMLLPMRRVGIWPADISVLNAVVFELKEFEQSREIEEGVMKILTNVLRCRSFEWGEMKV